MWAEHLGATASRIRAISEPGAIRESAETYLLSTATGEVNVKVRDDLLDVKTLAAIRDGFEQWSPGEKLAFPISSVWLEESLFPLWKVDLSPVGPGAYTFSQFIDEIVDPHDALAAVPVHKRRRGLTISGCIAEIADVMIGATALQTAAIESADLAALRHAVDQAGLSAAENTSYPRKLRQTLGWAPP